MRRAGGSSIDAGRALPLYGNEWRIIAAACAKIASSTDSMVLSFDPRSGSEEGDIRVSISPFLATTNRSTGRPPVGYRWTTVLGVGLPDSVTLTFVSCDTVVGFAPAGRCPEGGDYNQDSVHACRQGEIRWNDLGTRKDRLTGFLRELWGMEP